VGQVGLNDSYGGHRRSAVCSNQHQGFHRRPLFDTVFVAGRPAVKPTDRRRPADVFLPSQKQNGSIVFKRQRDENC